ncbi:MAG TPA: radical SAM protein [Candidatus Acidoferrum sp.]|jgi:DNA repair photolyase|nr:radical SAM protein [Candidatus Acidoferrum sp.]
MKAVSSPAPVADQRGSISDRRTADCPPASSAAHGNQNRANGPVRNPAAPLVGIARLAASSPAAETRRTSAERPEYFVLPVKSILNRCDSNRVPFEWTINPYRGCEFACKYCYARYTHEYMELDGGEFEKKIFVKKDAAPLLAWDVAHKYSYTSQAAGGSRPEHIAIGTATDPYQPAEREYGVTRACLEELAKREGLSVSIITKSNQIVRDIEVLKRLASRSNLAIDITITTLRPGLTRLLEPRAPRPDLRLAAVKQLREAGLAVGVSASPLIPGITDRDGDLEAVAAAAREAGAQWFFSGVLFLMPSAAKQFLPFLRQKFPRLAKQYEQWFSKKAYAPEEYRRKAAERVARIREKFGFASRPWVEAKGTIPCVQLPLTWDAAAVAEQLGSTRSGVTG